ncbi:site-specific integrase [Shewanella surugensis]|uniref:Site-specific integrase n=1 Tax=Shewanella surugensis TaxID=212020 RepID=A0ABT0LA95_9GAMM|nr:site-specific integrase [Shewanella surugensis]MCL1124479.1 site-specific integrase [Shewanella surugensis]
MVKDKPDPFTQEEIAKLATFETKRVSEILGFELACWTGLSVSELLAIAVDDIDLSKNTLTIRRANVNGRYKIPKEKSRERTIDLLHQARWVIEQLLINVQDMPIVAIDVLQRDNKTMLTERCQFLVHHSLRKKPIQSDKIFRERFFSTHCKKAGVRYRGPNQARHTFASQLLTRGVPKEWIANQMGHTSTKMIDDHYGTWMTDEAPAMGSMVSQMFGFSHPIRPPVDQRFNEILKNRYTSLT